MESRQELFPSLQSTYSNINEYVTGFSNEITSEDLTLLDDNGLPATLDKGLTPNIPLTISTNDPIFKEYLLFQFASNAGYKELTFSAHPADPNTIQVIRGGNLWGQVSAQDSDIGTLIATQLRNLNRIMQGREYRSSPSTPFLSEAQTSSESSLGSPEPIYENTPFPSTRYHRTHHQIAQRQDLLRDPIPGPCDEMLVEFVKSQIDDTNFVCLDAQHIRTPAQRKLFEIVDTPHKMTILQHPIDPWQGIIIPNDPNGAHRWNDMMRLDISNNSSVAKEFRRLLGSQVQHAFPASPQLSHHSGYSGYSGDREYTASPTMSSMPSPSSSSSIVQNWDNSSLHEDFSDLAIDISPPQIMSEPIVQSFYGSLQQTYPSVSTPNAPHDELQDVTSIQVRRDNGAWESYQGRAYTRTGFLVPREAGGFFHVYTSTDTNQLGFIPQNLVPSDTNIEYLTKKGFKRFSVDHTVAESKKSLPPSITHDRGTISLEKFNPLIYMKNNFSTEYQQISQNIRIPEPKTHVQEVESRGISL